MRIEVDWELCDGQGVCAEIAPTVFEVTEDDRVHVLDPTPPVSMEQTVAAAVHGCPKTALRLVE